MKTAPKMVTLEMVLKLRWKICIGAPFPRLRNLLPRPAPRREPSSAWVRYPPLPLQPTCHDSDYEDRKKWRAERRKPPGTSLDPAAYAARLAASVIFKR